MSMQDLVSDFVSRINNATLAGHSEVLVIKSNLIINVSKWLVKRKFLFGFEESGKYNLLIRLNLEELGKLIRISKTGKRVFANKNKFPTIVNAIGFNIISTPQGIKSDFECKKEKIGGEVLLQVLKTTQSSVKFYSKKQENKV
jgi:small subunit ribosomal protein S8